jgi:hypothetical protein
MMRLESGAEVGFESSWSVSGYPYSAVVIEFEGLNGKMLVSNDGLELDLALAQGDWPAGHSELREADLPQPARFDRQRRELLPAGCRVPSLGHGRASRPTRWPRRSRFSA